MLLLVLAVLAVSYASSAQAWLKQRSEINQLHADIAEREAAVAGLTQTQRRWHDPSFIEAEARRRLGWVMPGEVGYRVLDEDGSVLPSGGSELSDPVSPSTDAGSQWWDTTWGSVVEAGKDPDAADQGVSSREPSKRIGPHRPPRGQRPR